MKALLRKAFERSAIEAYTIFSNSATPLFYGVILKDEKRLYYTFASPTHKGRKVGITHHFIDFIVRNNAGKNLILDFEGSSIESVAQFYKKWGSKVEYFEVIKRFF